MPEDFNFNRRLINAKDDDQSDESEEEIRHDVPFQPSRKQKMRNIVQNFFNCNKLSTKKSNNEAVQKKAAKLLANLMCQNIKQIRLDDSKVFECKKSFRRANDESDVTGQNSACTADEESNSSLNRNDQIQVKQKAVRNERDASKTKARNDVKNKALNDLSFKGKVEVLKGSRRERTIQNESINTTQRTSVSGNSGLEYDRIRESLIKENERLHERSNCNVQRCSSAEVYGTKSKVNFFPRLKAFLENNVRKIWKPLLHSGSVVLMNEGDTNVMLAPFKSDLGQIVDKTVTSQNLSAPDLLSGGTVVLEGFADSFKTPNYYIENPLIVDLPHETPITKSSAQSLSSTVPHALATSFSGGSVMDNSSKGVSLPDLFPSQEPALYRPSVERNLSGGRLDKSCDAQNSICVDLLSHSLKLEGFKTPESPSSRNRNHISRVNNPGTLNTSLNELKSHPGLTYPSSNAEHLRRCSYVSRYGPTASETHATKSQTYTRYANTVNRSSWGNSNCNNAAAKHDSNYKCTRKDMARPTATTRNITESFAGSMVDQRRNRRSNTDGQTKTSTPNPKLRDLRGRSRYL